MKTMRMTVFLTLLSAAFFAGCEDDETEVMSIIPELKVQESVDCDWKGTPVAVAVATNQIEWLATVNEEARGWCDFVPRRDSIVLRPKENSLESSREAMIIITAGGLSDTLKVVQGQGSQPSCSATVLKLDFVWLETSLQTVVETNQTSWTAELRKAPWCTLKIHGNQLVVTAEANEGNQPRKGELVVTAGRAEPLVIPLSQETKKAPIVGTVAIQVTTPFDVSDVYEAWNGDKKVAEICNEYVPSVNPDARIVVAYPLLATGQPDLSKGLVIADGGRLDWSNGSAVYTRGNEPTPLQTIAFDGASLSAEVPAGSPQITVAPSLLKDKDNNRYRVVKIGTQYWMEDNLRTTTYADGSKIGVNYATEEGAWGLFEDKLHGRVDKETVGLLYNWYTLDRIAPEGWHVPDVDEWKALQTYLGKEDAALMRDPKGLWDAPCVAKNLSGFSALPGGYRFENGRYPSGYSHSWGLWWGTTVDQEDKTKAYHLEIEFKNDKTQLMSYNKSCSNSIRLLRD